MMRVIGWKVDDEDLRSIKLLEHIADTGRSPNITRLPDWASTVRSEEHTEALGHLGVFNDAGLLSIYEEHVVLPNLMISPAGAVAVQQIRADRADRRARDAGLHDALLAWVYDEALQGRTVPMLSNFVKSAFGRWYGEPFTEPEVAAASVALRDDDLISGSGSLGHGIIRPTLTARGRRLARSGGSVSDLDNQQSGNTVNFTMGDNSNAQYAGDNSTQTMNVTLTTGQRDDVARLIAGLRDLARTVPDADPAADEVEQAAASNDLGRLQRAFLTAQGAAMTAIGTDAGNQLVQLAHTLMQATH